MYPPDALDRVGLIRNGLAAGFTLKELATILRVRDTGGSPCKQVAELAGEKVRQLDMQIARLTQLRDFLQLTAREWNRRLEKMPNGGRAGLLESLARDKNQCATNMKGEKHEDTTGHSRPSNSGDRFRTKHNVMPNERPTPGKL